MCSLNKQVTKICENEYLWQLKLDNDYPKFYNNLSNYGKFIPIYYEGDRLGYIPFDPHYLEILINMIN